MSPAEVSRRTLMLLYVWRGSLDIGGKLFLSAVIFRIDAVSLKITSSALEFSE